MSNPKLTEWFDGSKFVPAHVGVYQRMILKNYAAYSKWDGENWLIHDFNIYVADQEKLKSNNKNLNWRGLAEQPK